MIQRQRLSINDSLIFKNFTYDLSNEYVKERIETVKALERMRMFSYKLMKSKIEKYMTMKNMDTCYHEMIDMYEAQLLLPINIEMQTSAIKLVIRSINPNIYLKSSNEAEAFFSEKWKEDIGIQLNRFCTENKLFYEKVFVVVKLFIPVLKFDYDFKIFKPIFDGITRSGLILTDDCNTLKFTVMVESEMKNIRTEITIYGNEEAEKIFSKFPRN